MAAVSLGCDRRAEEGRERPEDRGVCCRMRPRRGRRLRRLPLVQRRLLQLRLLLQRCLPVEGHLGHLAPLAWAEGVVAGADVEGLLGRDCCRSAWCWSLRCRHAGMGGRPRRPGSAADIGLAGLASSWWRTSAVLKRSATTHRLEAELECYGHNNRGVGNPESGHGVRRIPYRCGVHLFTSVARLSGIR